MEIGQLVVQIFAAIGSLASGAMLIYSIIIFKKNIIRSEATKIKEGLFVIERNTIEVGNSIYIEKAQIYEFLTKEPVRHTLLSIYNKIQVSYNKDIMQEVISSKLHEILPIKQFSLLKLDNEFRKLSEIKREFSVSLRKMNALKFAMYLYSNEYQNNVESLQSFFDESSLVDNIISVFYENSNRIMTFETFIDALCLKCYDSLNETTKNNSALLKHSYNISTMLINSLLDIPNDKELVENANEAQDFCSEAIIQESDLHTLFSKYDNYFKKTLSFKGADVNNEFVYQCKAYVELKQSSNSN